MTAVLSEAMLAVNCRVTGIVIRFGWATPTSGGGGVRPLTDAAGGGSALAGRLVGAGTVPRPISNPTPKAATTMGIQTHDRRIKILPRAPRRSRSIRRERRAGAALAPVARAAAAAAPTAALFPEPIAAGPPSLAARSPGPCCVSPDRRLFGPPTGTAHAPRRRRGSA